MEVAGGACPATKRPARLHEQGDSLATAWTGGVPRRRPAGRGPGLNGPQRTPDALRLLWMHYFDANTVADLPLIVQLLGDRDGLISREDSIDIEQFPGAAHLTVPDSGHDDLVDLSSERDPKSCQQRYFGIRRAVMGSVVPTKPAISPDAAPYLVPPPRNSGRARGLGAAAA
jgi:hypothetical protein